MNAVRALNFDSVSTSTSRLSANTTTNDDDDPTTTTSSAGTSITDINYSITTSLDNGKRHAHSSFPAGAASKNENSLHGSGSGGALTNTDIDVDDGFGSSLTVEQKFDALRNYVKELSADEWMYASGDNTSLK